MLCAAGCAKAPAPNERAPTPSAAPLASAPSASAAASGAGAPRWLGDGCHAGVGHEGSAAERLRRSAEACAPGAEALGEPQRLAASGEARFTLPRAGCLRVIAVSERADSDVALELSEAAGEVRAKDDLPGAIALAPPRGPLCLAAPGVVTAKAAGGPLLVSAWLAR